MYETRITHLKQQIEAGKTVHITLQADQGIGDELFFWRFLAEVNPNKIQVSLQASSKMQSLASRHHVPIDIEAHNKNTIFLGDLPALINRDIFAAPAPYQLTPLPKWINYWQIV